MPTAGPFEIVKPFAWMALIAFLVGFFSYMLLHPQPQTLAERMEPTAASTVSGPSSDDWNILKAI